MPIVVSLLLSTPSHAATAWLLWIEKTDIYVDEGKRPEETSSWNLITAEVTREACDAAQTEWLERNSKAEANVTTDRKLNIIIKTWKSGKAFWSSSLRTLCVPDTIDPRPYKK
jgi:hypothetical protein